MSAGEPGSGCPSTSQMGRYEAEVLTQASSQMGVDEAVRELD